MPLYVFRYNRNIYRLIIFLQVYPPNFRQYAQCFADNLHITMTSFPYFLLITLSKFVHYVDHIYVILFITLTEFTQSVNNTVFCGVGFQIIHSSISPNLWSFGNRCYLRTRQSGIIRLCSSKQSKKVDFCEHNRKMVHLASFYLCDWHKKGAASSPTAPNGLTLC